jgi:hypothetical protein
VCKPCTERPNQATQPAATQNREIVTCLIPAKLITAVTFTLKSGPECTTKCVECSYVLLAAPLSIYACNEANLMHYLSSVYSITVPLHVSGLLVAHHQEVTVYTCDNWYVTQARRQSTKTYNTYQLSHVYIVTS